MRAFRGEQRRRRKQAEERHHHSQEHEQFNQAHVILRLTQFGLQHVLHEAIASRVTLVALLLHAKPLE